MYRRFATSPDTRLKLSPVAFVRVGHRDGSRPDNGVGRDLLAALSLDESGSEGIAGKVSALKQYR